MLWRLLTHSSGSWRRLTAPKLSMLTAHPITSGGTRNIVFFSSKNFGPDSAELEQLRASNTAKDLELLAKDREILALKERQAMYEGVDRNNN